MVVELLVCWQYFACCWEWFACCGV